MKIEIEVLAGPKLRAVLMNDSYAEVPVLRHGFVGPSVGGLPPAVEATFGGLDEPMTLQPFTFYGREREYAGLPPGRYVAGASYTDDNGTTTAEAEFSVDPD